VWQQHNTQTAYTSIVLQWIVVTWPICVPKFVVYPALVWLQYYLSCKNNWCKFGIRHCIHCRKITVTFLNYFCWWISYWNIRWQCKSFHSHLRINSLLPFCIHASFLPVSTIILVVIPSPIHCLQRGGVLCRHGGVAENWLEPVSCVHSYSCLSVVDDNLWLCIQL
jgi:hypothetical protein